MCLYWFATGCDWRWSKHIGHLPRQTEADHGPSLSPLKNYFLMRREPYSFNSKNVWHEVIYLQILHSIYTKYVLVASSVIYMLFNELPYKIEDLKWKRQARITSTHIMFAFSLELPHCLSNN